MSAIPIATASVGASTSAGAGAGAERASPRRPHVLVVDDDPKMATVLQRCIERAGFGCAVAATGDEALWSVTAQPPDALVLDVMIPHPSGLEVCRHLRRGGYAGAIVVISARSAPEDRAAAARAGADGFLAKPFPLAVLVRLLQAATGPPGELAPAVADAVRPAQRRCRGPSGGGR